MHQKTMFHKVHKALHKAKTRKAKLRRPKEIPPCTKQTKAFFDVFALYNTLCAPCAPIRFRLCASKGGPLKVLHKDVPSGHMPE